ASQVIRRAVPRIAARLGRHGNLATGAVAKFSVRTVLGNVHRLYSVHVGRLAKLMAQPHRAAVNLKIVLQVRSSAQIHAVGRPRAEGQHFAALIDGLGSEQPQLERVAVVARCFGCEGGIYSAVLTAGGELNSRWSFRHRDALLHFTGPNGRIHRDGVAGLKNNVFLDEFAESCRLDRNGVNAGIEQLEEIHSGTARRPSGLYAGVDVAQCYIRARNDRTASVCYLTLHLAALTLGEDYGGGEQSE